MKRNTALRIILALVVLLIASGFVVKLDQSSPAGAGQVSQAVSISDAPALLQILVGLCVIFFGVLAAAPLFLEGQHARQAGIFNRQSNKTELSRSIYKQQVSHGRVGELRAVKITYSAVLTRQEH